MCGGQDSLWGFWGGKFKLWEIKTWGHFEKIRFIEYAISKFGFENGSSLEDQVVNDTWWIED